MRLLDSADLVDIQASPSAAAKCSTQPGEHQLQTTRAGSPTCLNDLRRPPCDSFTPRCSRVAGLRPLRADPPAASSLTWQDTVTRHWTTPDAARPAAASARAP